MTLVVTALALGTFTLSRLVVLAYTGLMNIPFTLWPSVFAKGLFFDAAVLAYILPPFLIADAIWPNVFQSGSRLFKARALLLTLLTFFLLFLGVMEITFWIEFHSRFNFIALDYLIYTNEVLHNIWQSYPIVKIVLALALLSWVIASLIHKRIQNQTFTPSSPKKRIAFAVAAVMLPLISALGVHIEMMYRQGNALAEEVSGNGLFTIAAAVRHNELDYEKFYSTIPQEKADKILRQLGVEWTEDAYRREFDMWGDDAGEHHPLPSFLVRRPKHIVLVSIESLSAKFVGAYGSTEGLTPALDRLAREGLLLTHVFATGTRTVRGLEALTLATPPIPGQAIVRRPENSKLASSGEMLRHQGYNVFFMYGGYGYFDNMNAFFRANAYDVFDRTSIPNDKIVFENVWGVADETLYDNALSILDQAAKSRKPMFAHIMTTSNHRPYTYPEGRIDIPSPGGRRGAVKYSDYALGKFIEDARTKPWFKDTVFVIVADHCASVAGKTELPVADYLIPLVIYGPGFVKVGKIDRMISQIDIAPTIFDILAAAGDDNLIGKELPEQTGAPRAFISNYQNLGYYKKNQLTVLKPNRRIEAYRIDPVSYEATKTTPDPELVDETIAYYQTTSRAYKLGNLKLLWK